MIISEWMGFYLVHESMLLGANLELSRGLNTKHKTKEHMSYS